MAATEQELSVDEAFRRRDVYMASIDPQISAREDALPSVLRTINASVPTKLRRVYAVVDELTAAARPFVACDKGCSACCHMNVMISDAEGNPPFSSGDQKWKTVTQPSPASA